MSLSRPASPARKANIQRRMLNWFATHKRDLPWRQEPRNPYHVWLAEIMLQQTQVATVIPYYRRWLERFPTLEALAEAPLDDVLKLWEGLGYYSRARNLHRAAQEVLRDHGGHIPDTVDELRKLPGIGPYTAGAIASLAFKRDAPILDSNVARVLSRLFAIESDVKSPETIAALWSLSESLLPKGHAGEFNEALMDHGAAICTPRTPHCPICPIRRYCVAHAQGTPEAFPVKAARKTVPHKDVGTAVIVDPDGYLLMAQRPTQGLLGGLWEFPGGEIVLPAGRADTMEIASQQLKSIIHDKLGLHVRIAASDFTGSVKHGFTHFHMTRHVALVRLDSRTPPLTLSGGYMNARWVTRLEIDQLALTRSDQRIAKLVLDRHPPI